jgi:hypothetical protein
VIFFPLPAALVVLALAVVLLGPEIARSDGKIPLPLPRAVVQVIVTAVQRNMETLALPGRAADTRSGLGAFLADIVHGVAYHPDLGAFNHYVDTSICLDGGMIMSAFGSPWGLVDLRAVSQLSKNFAVRAEMKENLYSIGAGLRIGGLEIRCTYHSVGLAAHAVSGLSLDGVIRW